MKIGRLPATAWFWDCRLYHNAYSNGMEATRLTVLGGGSVRCTAPVIASLATYFGERPLDIRHADSDAERLDLFDRLARVCFSATHSTHQLSSTTDFHEAMDGADLVIVQVGANCARKYLRATRRQGIAELDDRSMIEQAVESLVSAVPQKAELLSLVDSEIMLPKLHYYRLDWPDPIAVADRAVVPHQVLRWVRGEQGVGGLLRKYEASPLKAWLNSPTSAISVMSSPVV